VAIYPDNDDAQVARLAARLGADIDAVVALEDGLRPARVLPSGSACAGAPRRCSPLDVSAAHRFLDARGVSDH
jgi:hypothetical protein